MSIHQRKSLSIVFTIIALIGFALIGVTAWYFLQANQFSTYKDDEFGFSLKYPTSWTATPHINGTNVAFYSPLENALDVFKENVNIVVQDMSAQRTIPDLNQYTSIAINQMKVVFKKNFVLIESKPVFLSGMPAHQIIFIGKGPEMDLKFKIIWTLKAKRAYQFTYGAVASQYDKYIGKVDAMIRTFRVP